MAPCVISNIWAELPRHLPQKDYYYMLISFSVTMRGLALACVFLFLCTAIVDASAESRKKQQPAKKTSANPVSSSHVLGEETRDMERPLVRKSKESKKSPPRTSHVQVTWADRGIDASPSDDGTRLFDDRYAEPRGTQRKVEKKEKTQQERQTRPSSGKSNSSKGPRLGIGRTTFIDDYLGDEEQMLQRALEESLYTSSGAHTPHSAQSNRLSTPSYEIPLPEDLKVLGLKNRMNYCFLSSILQILKHIPGVDHWITSRESNNMLHMGLAMLFARLNPSFNTNDPGPQDLNMDMTHILSGLSKLTNANFETGKQDDVSEFWFWLSQQLPELFAKFFHVDLITWQEIGNVQLQWKLQPMDRLIVQVTKDTIKPIHELLVGKEEIDVHVRKSETENVYGQDDPEGQKGSIWEQLKGGSFGDKLSDTELNVLPGIQHTTISRPPILVIQAPKSRYSVSRQRTIWDYTVPVHYEPIIEIGEDGDKEEYQLVGTVNYRPGHYVARLLVGYKGVYQEDAEVEMVSSQLSSSGLEAEVTGDRGTGGVEPMSGVILESETRVKEGDQELEEQPKLDGDKQPSESVSEEVKRLVDVRRGVWATINDDRVRGIEWDAPFMDKESPYFFFYVKTSTLAEGCIDPHIMKRRVPAKLGLASQLIHLGHDLWRTAIKGTKKITRIGELGFRRSKRAVQYTLLHDEGEL